jgi:NitT/TauT family transport system substrate-binding protein
MPLALQLKFASKQDVKVLTWNHTNGSAITVAKSINNITELAGKTVAIPHWFSLHNVIIQQAFKTAGLKAIIKGDASAAAKTVKLVPAAPADMPVQLAAGQIAGYVVAEPFNALAEVKGIGKILRFSGDIWKDHACCVTLVRGDLVKNNPNAAQAIANVIAEAQLIIENDRNQAASNLSTGGYLPQALPAIKKALADYTTAEYPKAITHPEWKSQRISFHPFPFPSYTVELVKRLKSTAVDADKTFLKDIDLKKVHAQLVAVGFAEKAVKKNGGTLQYGLPKSLTRKEVIS